MRFLAPSEFLTERIYPIRSLIATEAVDAPSFASDGLTKEKPLLSTTTATATATTSGGDNGGEGGEDGVGAGVGDSLIEPDGNRGLDQKAQALVAGENDVADTPSIASIPSTTTSNTPAQAPTPAPSQYLPPPYPAIPPDDTIRRLTERPVEAVKEGEDGLRPERYTSERTQLVPSSSGTSAPGTLSGKGHDGEQPLFQRCEDEPIHIPGAVQKFGALVGVKSTLDDIFEVRICSENTRDILGYSPESLFNLTSFFEILEEASGEELKTRVANALLYPSLRIEDTHLDVFPVTVRSPDASRTQLWCAVHLPQDPGDLVILEFEVYSDALFLKTPDTEKLISQAPICEDDMEITPEEREKSTTSKSKSLRILQIARRRGQSKFSSMDIFNAMTQAQEQLVASQSLQGIFDVVIGLISELTGFHRVMFYRFDEAKNGCVEAELVNDQASRDIFRGTIPLPN